MHYWLMKTEPTTYSWDDLVRDGKTGWDGVRNYAARIHLNAMKVGDQVFIYHSMGATEIVEVAKVTKTAYQDPTTQDDRWVAVEIKPVKKLKTPVMLATVKSLPTLKTMALVRLGRLSVQPVTPQEFKIILDLSKE